jgi:hypothetical protein
MASSITFYNKFKKYILDGTIDVAHDTIKVMLVTSAYTFDATDDILADIIISPSPEVTAVASPDNGYTTGGEALTGQAVTFTDSPSQSKFDANDVTWTALTATFRGAVIYASGTLGDDNVVDPLIAYILFDTTPADVVVNGINYTIQWSANGIFTAA